MQNKNNRNTQIIVKPEPKKSVVFDFETLDNFQNNYCESNKKMKNVCHLLWSVGGRKSIKSEYRKHVSQKSKFLESFYNHDTLEFDTEKDKNGKYGNYIIQVLINF